MTDIILKPDPEALRTWGVLGRVSKEERDRILNLPAPHRQRTIARLEKEVREKLHRR